MNSPSPSVSAKPSAPLPSRRPLYLDHNATTPMHPEVAAALAEAWSAGYANPASQHRPGQRARRALDDARDAIGRRLGAQVDTSRPDQVVLTSGGTEANNLALLGLAGTPPARVIVSAIEHPSVLGPADELARRGFEVVRIRATADGVIDLERLREALASPTRLVSVMAANNETGVLQPIETIAAWCRETGARFHVDAAQQVGKLPVDFRQWDVTAMTVAPHKFQGPIGIGALVVRSSVAIDPILWGASQQLGVRPGTEGTPLAIGFQAALDVWWRERDERPGRLAAVRDAFESELLAAWPELVVIGRAAPRLPHVSNLAFPGFDRQELFLALDLAGIACSTGSACASGSSEPSPVLRAMGLEEAVVGSALRFSFGSGHTVSDAYDASQRILLALSDLRRKNQRPKLPGPPRQTPE